MIAFSNNDQTPPEHVSPRLCCNPRMSNPFHTLTPTSHPTEAPTSIATAHHKHHTCSNTTSRQLPRTTRHAPPRATAPGLGAPRPLHPRHRPPGATHPVHISPQPRSNTSLLPDALPAHPGRPPPGVPGLARDRGVDGKRRHVRARERAQNMHECGRPRRRAHAVLFLCRLSRRLNPRPSPSHARLPRELCVELPRVAAKLSAGLDRGGAPPQQHVRGAPLWPLPAQRAQPVYIARKVQGKGCTGPAAPVRV